MAVERQPRLQPQRIARAQADRFHLRLSQQRVGDRFGRFARHGDLEAVLAGVARPADPGAGARQIEAAGLHEGQLGHARSEAREHGHRVRALKREQRILVQVVDRDRVGQRLAQHGQVVPFGGPVDDDIQFVIPPGHHQVVQNTAALVQQQGVANAAIREARDVAGHHRLQRLGRSVAGEHDLAHMAHVEQAGMGARPEMLGHDAVILHRHLVSGEGHHASPLAAMPAVERQDQWRIGRDLVSPIIPHVLGRLVGGGLNGRVGHGRTPRGCSDKGDSRRRIRPPLSRNLRVSPSDLAYPVGGERRHATPAFQSVP